MAVSDLEFRETVISIKQSSYYFKSELRTENFQVGWYAFVGYTMFVGRNNTAVSRILGVLNSSNSESGSLRVTTKGSDINNITILTRCDISVVRLCPLYLIKLSCQSTNNTRQYCNCSCHLFFVYCVHRACGEKANVCV